MSFQKFFLKSTNNNAIFLVKYLDLGLSGVILATNLNLLIPKKFLFFLNKEDKNIIFIF